MLSTIALIASAVLVTFIVKDAVKSHNDLVKKCNKLQARNQELGRFIDANCRDQYFHIN